MEIMNTKNFDGIWKFEGSMEISKFSGQEEPSKKFVFKTKPQNILINIVIKYCKSSFYVGKKIKHY
jgi:hypothetical protein